MLIAGVVAYYFTLPPTPTPTPKILTLGLPVDIITLDPAVGSTEELKVIMQIYDTLVKLGTKTLPDGRIVEDPTKMEPALAESWEVSEDGKEVIFHIRKGVKFRSGRELDAYDVAYSIDRAIKINNVAHYVITLGLLGNLGVEALDKWTVKVTMKKPDPLILRGLATPSGGIIDREEVEAHGGVVPGEINEWMVRNTPASGPYLLERWTPGAEIVLVANKDYWAGPPYYDKIIFRIIEEPSIRLLLVDRGELDMVYDIPFKDLHMLEENPNLKFKRNPSLTLILIGLSATTKPLDNLKVRQALSYAVPYDRIRDYILYGYGRPATSMIPSFMEFHNGSFAKFEYNIEKAKELLKEAGYEDGFKLTIDVQAGIREFEEIVIVLQGEFKKIGVTLDINMLTSPSYFAKLRGMKSQMYIIDRTTGVNDPGYFLGYMLHTSPWHYNNYSRPDLDEILDAARFEFDRTKRQKLYNEAQRISMEDFMWLFLAEREYVVVMRKEIEGWAFYANEVDWLYDLYEK